MHLQCPHCQNGIELVEPREEVMCPSCGSSIQLEPGRTRTFIPSTTPRRIGKFELLEELGMGAFGTVYKARDTELDRVVAIKLPRAGNLATRDDADRFLREARSAAQLKHDRIVTVYDAGQTDEMCWLVSEYIQGETLSDRLQRQRYSFREAAQLLAELAEAVQFAHEHGVIHRDLKPSNVMLDMDGRPHVMDFGLAKRETGEITMTIDGQILGTPAYMSPEQAQGESHLVDGRSDVYSLGVILYELLTGELPFRGNKRMLMVQVLQDDPRPPRRLNDHIPRDLETITLRCMAKEPGRRYQTAAELADDLRCFLREEPIRARPISRAERSWRWIRRNPRVSGLAAAVLLLLVAIAAGSSIAAAMLDAANARERQARRDIERQKERADANFEVAREAVDRYFVQVSESEELKAHGLEQLRQNLLKTAVEYYQRFVEQKSDDPRVQREQANAYKHLAAITSDIDSSAHAIQLYRRTIAVHQELGRENPDEIQFQLEVATAHNNIGQLLYEMGRFQDAEREVAQALELRQAIVQQHPEAHFAQNDLAASYNVLGLIYRSLDRFQDAETAFLEGMRLREQLVAQHPDNTRYLSDLGRVYSNLANLYRMTGNVARARELLEKDLQTGELLLAANPDDPAQALSVSSSCNNLANILRAAGQVVDAEKLHLRALQLREKLASTHPSVTLYQQELALSHYNLGNLYRRAQRMADAEKAYEQSLAIRQRLLEQNPQVATHRQALGFSYNSLAILYRATDRFEEARAAYGKALSLRRELVAEQPDSTEYLQDLAATLGNLGNLYGDMRMAAEAEDAYRQAVDIKRQLYDKHPSVPSFLIDLGDAYYNMGIFARDEDRHVAAEEAFDNVITLLGPPRPADSLPLGARQTLAGARSSLALLYQLTDRIEQAQTVYQQALAEQEQLLQQFPAVASVKLDLADTACGLGHLHRDTKAFEQAMPWYRRSIELLEPFMQQEGSSSRITLAARRAYRGLAFCLAQLGRHDEALPSWNRTLSLEEGSARDWDELQLARSEFHLGQHEQAVKRIEEVAERSPTDGQMLFEAARVLASSIPLTEKTDLPDTARKNLAEQRATRAVQLLRRAKDTDYFVAEEQRRQLETDTELQGLRGRDDFQVLFP